MRRITRTLHVVETIEVSEAPSSPPKPPVPVREAVGEEAPARPGLARSRSANNVVELRTANAGLHRWLAGK